jgi:hypothetical protein
MPEIPIPIIVFVSLWISVIVKFKKMLVIPVVVIGLYFIYKLGFGYDWMEEEFFPSDHKLLIATFKNICTDK